jgi:alpha-glucuronidase
VPYKHPLKSGKTVIQHIYNSHYNGTREAARMVDKWQLLEGRVDDQRYRDVLTHLTYQAGHAQVWRDAVCNWFLRKSGITDDEGRVGNSPRRFEAESMQLDGYEPQNVTPWETASGGQCVASVAQGVKGTVSFKYDGEPGWFDLSVNYYDENDGASQFQLLVAGEVVDQWVADDALPGSEPNGDTSTRHVTRSLALRKGDELRISTVANGGEQACIDYVAINAVKN